MVAVDEPSTAVVSVGEVASTTLPDPVVAVSVTADSLTPSFVAGAAAVKIPAVAVAGGFHRYAVPPVAGAAQPALFAVSAGMLPVPAIKDIAAGVVPEPVKTGAVTPPVPV